MSIPQKFEETVSKFGEKEALIYQGGRFTYNELKAQIDVLSSGLRGLGIKKQERVALLLPNSPQFVIAYFAIVKLGAIALPLNFLLKGEEISYILNDSEAVAIITTGQFSPAIDPKIPSLKHIIASLDELTEAVSPAQIGTVDIDDEGDIAALIYTSGTTGHPKGAMLTHRNLLSNVNSIFEALNCSPDERLIAVLPLFHAFGATVCMLAPLLTGASTVIAQKFQPNEVLREISEKGVTIFAGVPSMYVVWANMPKPELNFSSWRICVSGGAALPVEVMRRFEEKYNIPIYEGDGPTECSPATSFNPLNGIRKPGSIGIPLPDVQMKIFDDNDRELLTGEIGEIVVRGPNVMKGYWNRPQETEEALRNGWLHTGDLGRVDEDGYFYIVDRKKDMVIVGGLNVYSREVEEVLYKLQGVAEAAVIGVKDELHGEVPAAFIVLKEGTTLTAKDVTSHCRKHLATYKVPRRVEFRGALPKNATGKILKRELK